MITIYELLDVEEDASKEEIESAYSRLVLEYRQDIKFDEKTNKENEVILNRLKLAYEILTDDAKRKRYDNDLAQKRAESLIENVVVSEPKQEETAEESEGVIESNESNVESSENSAPSKEVYTAKVQEVKKQEEVVEEGLTDKEKSEIRKAAQKEFKQKLKKVKQAEAEYNEAYNKAYNDYLRKMGYKVEEPWTFKRVRNLIISILVLIVVIVILWNIPPVKEMLNNLYEENFIIKAIVDLINAIKDTLLGK